MKKVIKNIAFIILVSILMVYSYTNNVKVKKTIQEIIYTIKLYTHSISVIEYEYNEKFRINDIKVKPNNYYYEKLTDNQKSIYKSLANGIKKLDKEIILKDYKYVDSQTSSSDVEVVFTYFCLDHPEIFYLNSKYVISNVTSVLGKKVIIGISYSVENMGDLDSKVERMNGIIDEYLKKVENKTEFEKEIIIHDELAKNINYLKNVQFENIPEKCHTIEGAFFSKTAVCDGLAKAMQILLNNADIKNIIVTGELDYMPHAWNKVQLDEKWYNVDLTSDNTMNIDAVNTSVIHSYFNISDEVITSTHKFSNKSIVPISEDLSDKYNYYIYTNKYIKKEDDFELKLKEMILENTNEDILEFYVEDVDSATPININNAVISSGKENYLFDRKVSYQNRYNTYIIKINKKLFKHRNR